MQLRPRVVGYHEKQRVVPPHLGSVGLSSVGLGSVGLSSVGLSKGWPK